MRLLHGDILEIADEGVLVHRFGDFLTEPLKRLYPGFTGEPGWYQATKKLKIYTALPGEDLGEKISYDGKPTWLPAGEGLERQVDYGIIVAQPGYNLI